MVPPRRKPEARASLAIDTAHVFAVRRVVSPPWAHLWGHVHPRPPVRRRAPSRFRAFPRSVHCYQLGSILFGPSSPIPACHLTRCLGVDRVPADRQPSVSQRSRCRTPKVIPGQCSLGPFMSSVDCPSCMDTSFWNCTVGRGRPPPLLSCIRQSD